MILYRLTQYTSSGTWAVQWHPTREAAQRWFLRFHKAGIETVVHRTDVPTDKTGLVNALNMADANPMNWPYAITEILSSRKMPRRAVTP